MAHLLHCLAIGKNILNDDVKFAEVVLAKSISVPAHGLQQHALNAIDGKIEADVPFWIEILADGRSRLFGVSKVYNKVLLSSAKPVLIKMFVCHKHSQDHWCHSCLLLPSSLP